MKFLNKTISFISLLLAFQWADATCHAVNANTMASANTQTIPAPVPQSKEAFVTNMIHSVLVIVRDDHRGFTDKQSVLRQEFTNVVDINWIARFVLGQTWNTATPEQKTHYTDLYRQYLTDTYVSNFNEDSERKLQDIKLLSLHDEEDNTFAVHTDMLITDAEDVKVDYLIANRDGQYKVIDIIIEGVSLLATHRSQFTELAASKGMDGLITQLQQMVNRNKAIALSMR